MTFHASSMSIPAHTRPGTWDCQDGLPPQKDPDFNHPWPELSAVRTGSLRQVVSGYDLTGFGSGLLGGNGWARLTEEPGRQTESFKPDTSRHD